MQTEEQKKMAQSAASQLGLPTPISVSGITSEEKPITVPTPTTPSFQGTTASNLESLLGAFNEKTPEETQQNTFQQDILKSLETLGTEKTRRAEEEAKAGLPEQRTEIKNILAQMKGLQIEATNIPLEIQKEFEGRGVTGGGIAPIEAGRVRENAIKSNQLAIRGNLLLGNIQGAEENITNALEAEFGPEKAKLETLKQLYEFNKDDLARVDKKRADMLNIVLNERERILNEKREEKKFGYDIMLEASRAGAPQDVLTQIQNATPDEAIALATDYLGADFKQKAEQQAFENGIALRSIAVQEENAYRAKRNDLIERAKAGDKMAIKELGYDPNNLPLNPEEIDAFEDQQALIQKDLNVVTSALKNSTGLQRASGITRGAIGSFFFEPGGYVAQPYGVTKEQNFLADSGYIVKNLTFNKIRELAQMGVKLTPISERELRAMGDASSVLAAAAEFNDGGSLIGFNLSEKRVKEELQKVQTHYANAIADIDKELLLSKEEQKEITDK